MASRLFWFILTLALALVLTGCAGLKSVDQANRVDSRAIANPETTPLGKQIRRLVRTQPAGQSGFLLLDKGEEALLWRGMLADQATRTIDTPYFIWYQDNVGKIAAERLLRAAEQWACLPGCSMHWPGRWPLSGRASFPERSRSAGPPR